MTSRPTTTPTSGTDGGAYLPGGAHIPVRPTTPRTLIRAAATIHRHTSPDERAEIARILGLEPRVMAAGARFVERWDATPDDHGAPAVECPHADVFPAWEATGAAFAMCGDCGRQWRSQQCKGCGLPVTAVRVARAGPVHRTDRCEAAAAKAATMTEEPA